MKDGQEEGEDARECGDREVEDAESVGVVGRYARQGEEKLQMERSMS